MSGSRLGITVQQQNQLHTRIHTFTPRFRRVRDRRHRNRIVNSACKASDVLEEAMGFVSDNRLAQGHSSVRSFAKRAVYLLVLNRKIELLENSQVIRWTPDCFFKVKTPPPTP